MIHPIRGGASAPPGPGRRPIGPPLLPGLVFCALFWGGTALHAQEAAGPSVRVWKLSVDEAVDLAVKNNLSLESSRVALDTKRRKSDLAWNQFLPSVSVSGSLIRDNWATTQSGSTTIGVPPGVQNPLGPGTIYEQVAVVPYSMTLPDWHVNGTLSVSYDFSFALVEGIKSIRLDYEAGMVTFEKAKRQLEQSVRKTYNQILISQAALDLQRESFAMAERRAAMADASYKAGTAPRLSLLQAQVAVETTKPAISDTENNIKALKANFAMSLGLPYDTVFELEPLTEGDFGIPLDVAELISQAASGKPDIMELQKQIQTLESQRKAQALQLYTPFIRLSWGLSSTFIQDPWKESWFEGDNWNKGGNFSLTLGISLNGLFPFTKEGQGLKDVENTLRTLNIGLAQTVLGTELEVFTKVNSLEKTRINAEAQQATVELAELSYRLTEDAYRAGLQDLLEVQNASQSLNQAKLQLLTQRFNYLNDLIDLEYYIGVPFGTLLGGNL